MTSPLVRRPTLIVVFAALAMWSCALALAQPTQLATTQPAQPLSIARQGYFFVGGHLFAVNGDLAMAGQMFVQYQVPAGTIRPYPVVMVHGGGQTGTNFLGTPDGRPGWNEWFLRQGYAVYIIDQPARGRSAYYAAVQGPLAPSLAHGTEQRFTAPEKYNLWPQAKLHTQWPGSGKQGDPIFDQFFASQETSITDNILMDESNRDDLVALLERIGPAIMLTHSRSGPFGWLVADARPDLVRAILAIEPNGPPFFDVVPSAATPTFVRTWGIAYAKLHFDPPVEQPASLAPGLDASDDGPDMERCWLPTGAKLHEVTSYRACFKAQLPEFFIKRLTKPGDAVYDPFMGRGTIAVQAALMGRRPIGNDINPLSILLTGPRLTPPTLHEIARRLGQIRWDSGEIDDPELLVFYSPRTLRHICALRSCLRDQAPLGRDPDPVDDWIRMVAINRLTGHSPKASTRSAKSLRSATNRLAPRTNRPSDGAGLRGGAGQSRNFAVGRVCGPYRSTHC